MDIASLLHVHVGACSTRQLQLQEYDWCASDTKFTFGLCLFLSLPFCFVADSNFNPPPPSRETASKIKFQSCSNHVIKGSNWPPFLSKFTVNAWHTGNFAYISIYSGK